MKMKPKNSFKGKCYSRTITFVTMWQIARRILKEKPLIVLPNSHFFLLLPFLRLRLRFLPLHGILTPLFHGKPRFSF